MKKTILIFICFSMIISSLLRADEGMWLPMLIKKYNYNKMKEMGLELTAEDIYSINNSSIKDAIAGLGDARMPLYFYCTGEIISPDGLLLTNHHCAYDVIQTHSTIEHDFLSDGFWAMSREEELTYDGMTVSFVVRMEDVTDSIISELNDTMSEEERSATIYRLSKEIEKQATKDTHYKARVNSMFENNQFYLIVYEIFEDIRLAGAPPSSIGKFGGDTDNWMWPRHTGDFALFRIYMSPDGKPAKYSPVNIPYKSKHHLPISLKGVNEGDFAMVFGFPGGTERYLTSYGIEETLDIMNPSAIKIRTKKLEIMKEDMDNSAKVRLQYASKYAQTSNYWKYYIGQSKGLRRLNVYDEKKELEDKFQKWLDADNKRTEKYGESLDLIEKAYSDRQINSLAYQYLFEAMFQGGEIAIFPLQTFALYSTLLNSPKEKELINELVEGLKKSAKDYFKNYNALTDKKLFTALLKMYYEDVPKEYYLNIFAEIEKKYKGNFDKFVDEMFEKSIFADSTAFYDFLSKPNYKVLDKDMAFKTMRSIQFIHLILEMKAQNASDMLNKGRRLFVSGLLEMEPNKAFYPDANSTLRLSYGTVGKYDPMDAVHYNYYTTLKGIMEKEDPNNDEFIVPEKLKELYEKKNYGRYGENDEIRACFITNNDITGGNSGSPVINGNGELVGIAFDGNWEGMSGDIAFETELQKCINCDIRYVLFIIDKFAGARHLIDEMTIVY